MRELIARWQGRRGQRRTLGSYLARTLLPRAVLFLALAASILVGNAMSVSPTASPADSEPSAVPSWSAAEAQAHPDCVPAKAWPEGRLADAVIGYNFREGVAQRLGFDRAWELNHNDSEADDVWVIGVCP